MTRLFLVIATLLIIYVLPSAAQFIIDIYKPPTSGDVTFTLPTGDSLHFITTSGNGGSDVNDGLAPTVGGGHGPWLTPNHALHCGDVILAQGASNYDFTNFSSNFGAVTNCPSTTGGIDGNGGIYFVTLLCAGSSVGDCGIPPSGCAGANAAAMNINANNWAVEGWKVSLGYKPDPSPCTGFGIAVDTSAGPGVLHHIAMINNIATFNASGFTANSMGANAGSGFGVDYWAIVGNIAQDSAGRCDGFYDAAIDVIGTKNFDTVAGTHYLVDGNFSYNNQQGKGSGSTVCPSSGASDGESYMFDTLDALSTSNKIVFRNNFGVLSERFGLQIFYQALSVTSLPLFVYNNTLFASMAESNSTPATMSTFGDYDIQSTGASLPWVISVYNNIAKENWANGTTGTGDNTYALMIGGNYTTTTIGNTGSNPSGSENIFKGKMTSCTASFCDGGNNAASFGTSGNLGVNTYTDPLFNNESDLLTNRIGPPNCSGFTNTAACLGWNYRTQTATNPSFIYDLIPNCASCSGKGVQLPKAACETSDSDYPSWLKGINYMTASGYTLGATITVHLGLSNRPC